MNLRNDAQRHRSLVQDVVFIGITGSCGKTTTKNLSAYLLQPDLLGFSSADDGNCGYRLVSNLLRVKPSDDFYIQELGAWGPGTLDDGLMLVRPDIGVVLNIRNDHYSGFRGLTHTQAEKSKIIRALPPTGTAILNADDPYVWEMRHWTAAAVFSFGSRQGSDLRAERIQSKWPDRLSFDLSYREETHRVETRLLGEHLAGSALAALAIAVVMGVSLKTAIDRLSEAPPTPRRMSPVFLENGITFIRDDFKAPSDSITEAVRFLSEARANRKIAILGRISDHRGRSRPVYNASAKAIAEVVDILVLVGERAEDLWGRQTRASSTFLREFDSSNAAVRLFETVCEASNYLRGELRPNDFVLLKGSGVSDHLERILLQFETAVRCWKRHCGLIIACDSCELLGQIAEPC